MSESLPGLPLPANVSCVYIWLLYELELLLLAISLYHQLLWLAMSLLVFCGAYFGYNKPEIEFPGQSNTNLDYFFKTHACMKHQIEIWGEGVLLLCHHVCLHFSWLFIDAMIHNVH